MMNVSVDSPYNHRRSTVACSWFIPLWKLPIYKPKLRLSDDNEKADGHTINCVDVNQEKKNRKKIIHDQLIKPFSLYSIFSLSSSIPGFIINRVF
jgi:hypothetical protein